MDIRVLHGLYVVLWALSHAWAKAGGFRVWKVAHQMLKGLRGTRTRICAWVCICTYLDHYVYVYPYMYVCGYVCMHACTYTYCIDAHYSLMPLHSSSSILVKWRGSICGLCYRLARGIRVRKKNACTYIYVCNCMHICTVHLCMLYSGMHLWTGPYCECHWIKISELDGNA